MKKVKTEECCTDKNCFSKCRCHHGASSNAIYGLGIIGALFYFLQSATTFGAILIGIGKSIFWPAVLLFKVLTLLQL